MATMVIGVVGVGRLGSDVALTLAERDLCDVLLYDQDVERARYLAEDLSDTSFGHVYNSRIRAVESMASLADCDVVLIAAGARMEPGGDAADLLRSNSSLVHEIAAAFVGSSAVFVVASEPIDLMTTALRRELGIPGSRVLGLGGVVDSYWLRHELASKLDFNPEFLSAHVIGPHGAGAKVVWEFTTSNGIPISTLIDEVTREQISTRFSKEVRERLERMNASQSRYAPAMAAFDLVRAIVTDDKRVMSVSMEWGGELGVQGVAMSVPAIVGRLGADRILMPDIDDASREALHAAAKKLQADASVTVGVRS